ncbi:BAP_1a_G0000860.mRNA.1.CDS.1 [Saccharomyces cerevisiae]|nr:BAP_1a_G0000860.mRNA.1.CDS.1 [Saccharomyces cerevisiae]CAI7035745.1 BAP_1a_G0000860.mRNA.1.CDS.1 [Saccharomyces cerevisiae]
MSSSVISSSATTSTSIFSESSKSSVIPTSNVFALGATTVISDKTLITVVAPKANTFLSVISKAVQLLELAQEKNIGAATNSGILTVSALDSAKKGLFCNAWFAILQVPRTSC